MTEAEIRAMDARNRERNKNVPKGYGMVTEYIENPTPEEQEILARIAAERMRECGRKMAEAYERKVLDAIFPGIFDHTSH